MRHVTHVTGGPINPRPKHRNLTVGCGIEQTPNPCNATEHVGIPQHTEIAFVQKGKFNEIHSEPIYTEVSFGDQNVPKRHFSAVRFRMYFIEFSFPNTQNLGTNEISVLCGITEIWHFFNPTTHCGIATCSPGVHRAPCVSESCHTHI